MIARSMVSRAAVSTRGRVASRVRGPAGARGSLNGTPVHDERAVATMAVAGGAQLRHEGEPVGRRRVARLMRGARLQGRSARRYHRSRPSRAFFASVPNQQRGKRFRGRTRSGSVMYLRQGRQPVAYLGW